jgi:hypothetical protein
VEPEAGVQVAGIEPSTRSEAEAEKMTTAPPGLVACTVISDGSVNFGGVLSATVTLKEAEPMLPALSVTEHVTMVEPTMNVEPDAGVQVGVKEPSTASNAEAVNVTTAPTGPVASTLMSTGTVTTGAVLS